MKISDETKSSIVKDYQSGIGYKDIYKKYHVAYRIAHKILEDCGIKSRPKGNPTSCVEPERLEKIKNQYLQEDLTLKEIGKQHGVSRQAIEQILSKHGIPKRVYNGLLAIQINEEPPIVEAYKNGASIRNIANKLDVNPDVIRRIILKNNMVIRPARIISPSHYKYLVRDYLRGCFTTEIAEKYGVCQSSVINILKKNNVKLRRLKKISIDAYPKIMTLKQSGKTPEQIAEIYNISSQTVRAILNRVNQGYLTSCQQRSC